MTLPIRLLLSLVIAGIAATLTAVMQTGNAFSLGLLAAFAVTAVASTLLPSGTSSRSGENKRISTATGDAPAETNEDSNREYGEVKWFNVSKGFGFIIKEDGEEIFVHFRSIRGQERNGLRDGQRVSFTVAESDKGPQAEDVMAQH